MCGIKTVEVHAMIDYDGARLKSGKDPGCRNVTCLISYQDLALLSRLGRSSREQNFCV